MNALALIAEERIREAESQGVFDSLEGMGHPLCLDDAPMVPEELRMAYTILKNSGYLPPEVAERREIENLLELVESHSPEYERLAAIRKLEAILFAMQRKGVNLPFSESQAYYDSVVQRLARAGRTE